MVSPILDEDWIKKLLQHPPTTENIGALQAGALQCMLDMYDRKVTREEWVENHSKCVTLYTQVAKLYLIEHVHNDLFKNNLLSEETFVNAENALMDLIRVVADDLIGIMKRLELCPRTEDKVH